MKHTPGPWMIEKGHIYGANGHSICQVHCFTPMECDRHTEEKANARLIAAAPDMLASLKEVRFIINSDPTLHHLRSEPWWSHLGKAIAKAERGE